MMVPEDTSETHRDVCVLSIRTNSLFEDFWLEPQEEDVIFSEKYGLATPQKSLSHFYAQVNVHLSR